MCIIKAAREWNKSKGVVNPNEVNKNLDIMRELAEEIIKLHDDMMHHEYNEEELQRKMVELENKEIKLDCTVEKISDLIKSNKYKPRSYKNDPWYKYYCNCVKDVQIVTWKFISDYYSGRHNHYMHRCLELIDQVQDANKEVEALRLRLEEVETELEQMKIEKEEFPSYPMTDAPIVNMVEPTAYDYLKHLVYLIECRLVIAEKVSDFDFNRHDAVYYNRCLCIKPHVFRNMFHDMWPNKTGDEIIETLKNHSQKTALKLTSNRDTILIPYITKKWGPEHYFYAIYTSSYDYIYANKP